MRAPTAVPRPTAREHPKRDAALWIGVILSVGIHFLAFAYWPEMTAEKVVVARSELTALELPPDVEIPPQPKAIARPATPVVATAEVSDEVTIAPTTFEANPVSDLPLPPPPPDDETSASLRDQPVFTPFTVRPRLLNRDEVARLLVQEYPPLLKEARIGGSAVVWFFIDEEGRVLETRIQESSGHPKLDQAALRVASAMRFSPALNRDKEVQVWVRFPVVFQVK